MYCPYCFSSLKTPMMVCKNAACGMYEQSMPLKPRKLLSRLPEGWRIRGGALFADQETKCEACGLPCAAVCEACGRSIPSAWLRYPGKNVLFLGVSGMGKSTLLAATKMKLSQRQDVTMTPLEIEQTAERFYEQYASPLLEKNQRIPPTEKEAPVPFLWGVSARQEHQPACTMALAMYDVAGEMLSRHAEVKPIETLLTCADSVMLVINPAALPALYDECGRAAGVAPAANGWEKAERILDEILKYRSIGVRSDVKLAVVFTHLDVWFSTVAECDSSRAVNDPLLRKLAASWNGGAFLARLNEFKDHRLFATGLYWDREFRPLDGAEAPLLYLMERMGMPLKQ